MRLGAIVCLGLMACDATTPLAADDAAGLSDTVPRLDTSGDASAPAPDSAPVDSRSDAPVESRSDATADADSQPQDTQVADSQPQDTQVADSQPQDTDIDSDPDTTVGPEPDILDNGLNASWIGGACSSPADCDHPAFSEPPLCLTTDFPNGFCTQACRQSATSGAWVCPDADTATATVFTTTRCISAGGAPRCVAECDFAKAESGCRPGYGCVLRSRHGAPDSVFPVCLPGPQERWPGEPEPARDIGQPCSLPSECGNRSCLSLPGGYCSKSFCGTTGCPGGSSCFGFSGGESACLEDCGVDSECRNGEGYECDGDGTCWPGQNRPSWAPTVGAMDCSTAWGNAGSGLSPCDTTKDDYVVLRKSARNMALCQSGTLVANFQTGLGFAPVGDKQVEGDGKTPEGVFYAAQLLPASDYYRAFLASYPDAGDATRGLAQGLITATQKGAIEQAQAQCGTPPQSTALGGWIELHGEGGQNDWTLGCAALDNTAIDVLWNALGVRDTLVIWP